MFWSSMSCPVLSNLAYKYTKCQKTGHLLFVWHKQWMLRFCQEKAKNQIYKEKRELDRNYISVKHIAMFKNGDNLNVL